MARIFNKKILENPHYTGTLQQCREYRPSVTSKRRRSVNLENQIIIEKSHEPIIPLEDFLIVQEILITRKEGDLKLKYISLQILRFAKIAGGQCILKRIEKVMFVEVIINMV